MIIPHPPLHMLGFDRCTLIALTMSLTTPAFFKLSLLLSVSTVVSEYKRITVPEYDYHKVPNSVML